MVAFIAWFGVIGILWEQIDPTWNTVLPGREEYRQWADFDLGTTVVAGFQHPRTFRRVCVGHFEDLVFLRKRDDRIVHESHAACIVERDASAMVLEIALWREEIHIELWTKDDVAGEAVLMPVFVVYNESCRTSACGLIRPCTGFDHDVYRRMFFGMQDAPLVANNVIWSTCVDDKGSTTPGRFDRYVVLNTLAGLVTRFFFCNDVRLVRWVFHNLSVEEVINFC